MKLRRLSVQSALFSLVRLAPELRKRITSALWLICRRKPAADLGVAAHNAKSQLPSFPIQPPNTAATFRNNHVSHRRFVHLVRNVGLFATGKKKRCCCNKNQCSHLFHLARYALAESKAIDPNFKLRHYRTLKRIRFSARPLIRPVPWCRVSRTPRGGYRQDHFLSLNRDSDAVCHRLCPQAP